MKIHLNSKILDSNIGFKLSLLIVTFLGVVGLIACLFMIPRYRATTHLATINAASGQGELAAQLIVNNYLAAKDDTGFSLTKSMRQTLEDLPAIHWFDIVDQQGSIVYTSRSIKGLSQPPPLTQVESSKATQTTQTLKYSVGGETTILVPTFTESGTHNFTVRYMVNLTPVNNITIQIATTGLILYALTATLLFLFVYWLTQRLIVQPINSIRGDINIIMGGDTNHRLHLQTINEFGALATTINTLVQNLTVKIKELEEEQAWKNEFIILASHNLRTPLSVIMSSVASLKKVAVSKNEATTKYLEYIYSRGKELHNLIENLLSISTLKGKRLELENEPFDLLAVVNSIAKDLEPRLKEKGLQLVIETRSNHIIAKGDGDQMFQILDNLVDNAIKFTTTGTITIRLDDSKDMIAISVIDTGDGIPQDMVRKLFQSFRRGNNPLSVDQHGAGLGLYYVKLAIESQGGEVTIKSQVGKGTQISLTIPKGNA